MSGMVKLWALPLCTGLGFGCFRQALVKLRSNAFLGLSEMTELACINIDNTFFVDIPSDEAPLAYHRLSVKSCALLLELLVI